MSTSNRNSTPLLWIVKDPQSASLTHSDQAEATEISKFVQQRPRKASTHGRHRKNRKYDFVAFRTTSQQAHDHNLEAAPNAVLNCIPFDQANNRILYAGQWLHHFSTLSKDNILFRPGIDPFQSAVVPITSDLHDLIGYSRASILVGAGGHKTEMLPPHLRPFADIHDAAAHLVLTDILRFKHVLYPMLAAFSQRLHCRAQYPFASAHNPDRYVSFGLQALGAAISEGYHARDLAKSLAFGIYFMVFCTGMAGRIAESQLHIRGFLRLLPYINTRMPAEYWLFDAVTSMDIINSSHQGNCPLIGFASGDPGPIPRSRRQEIVDKLAELKRNKSKSPSKMCDDCEAIEFGSNNAYMRFDLLQSPLENLGLDLGSSLIVALHSGKIHPRLSSMVSKILDCVDVAKVVWHAGDFVTKQDSAWLCRRVKGLVYELLSMQSAFTGDTISFHDHQARCLLLTLIITVTGAYHRMLHLSRESLTMRLKAAMEDLLSHQSCVILTRIDQSASVSQDRDTLELYLWMLFMGYWASAWTSVDSSWFKEHAANIARALDLRSQQELHQVMDRYLWSKTLQHDSLSEIWELV